MTTHAGRSLFEAGMDDRRGNAQSGSLVTVYLRGTTTPATLYTDRTKASQTTNPVTTNSLGNIMVFADPGEYDALVNGATLPFTVLPDPEDTITNPYDGEAMFTGTVVVTADAVFDVRGYPGWDPIAADNDAAVLAALEAAFDAGGGRVLLPPLLKIASLIDVPPGVDIEGRGSRQTGGASEVRCTAVGAGLRYGDTTTPQSGGVSSGFRVNGNGVATGPFRVGLAVGRTFMNIDVDGSEGTGLLLQGTGNCCFIEFNVQGSATDGCQVDRAAGCSFLKCEFGSSDRYNLNIMSGGPALPFGVDYPLNNAWYSCIFEYHSGTTVATVRQGAGINNMLSDCILATSESPMAEDLRLLILEREGSPFSTNLRLRDCSLVYNFTDPDTVAATIGDGTRLILTGSTSLSNAGTGFRNDTNGILEADRIIATSVAALRATTAGGLAYMRIRPDITDPIACSGVTGVNKALPIYDGAGVLQGYVAVGQTLI